MKKILGTLALCLLLTGCGGTNSYKTISASEAKSMMNDETIILDVRTEEEYEISHIKNAINIPLDTIDESVSEILNDKNQTILVYCQSGNRSVQASQKLVNLGYKKIYNFGGINDWQGETASPRKDNSELLLSQIVSAVKYTYLSEELDGHVDLPFQVDCDGTKCTYGDNQTLTITGNIVPTGTITLGNDGNIEKTSDISLNGYSCSIGENEEITCL